MERPCTHHRLGRRPRVRERPRPLTSGLHGRRGFYAAEVVDRGEVVGDERRPMGKERWAAAVDCVGGSTLAGVIKTLRYGAAVAASGNTGGADLHTTVFPFILRGVALLGIDSVNCPAELRQRTWERLAGDLRPAGLDESIAREITLDELDDALDAILRGDITGRTVVRLDD